MTRLKRVPSHFEIGRNKNWNTPESKIHPYFQWSEQKNRIASSKSKSEEVNEHHHRFDSL